VGFEPVASPTPYHSATTSSSSSSSSSSVASTTRGGSAKRRYQSPEWTILSHRYRLIQGEIVRPQVLLDSLHPCGTRTSWWSPPVLRRGSSYDTSGICLVWHSRNVAEQRKTLCLDNSRQAWLPGCLNSSFRT